MRPARDRTTSAILVIATVAGFWLGLTAPATSPVSGPAVTSQVVAAQAP